MDRAPSTNFDRLLTRWASLVNTRPGWVLIVSVFLTLLVLPVSHKLEIIWGEDALYPSGRGDHRERAELADRLGPTGMVVAIVEGGTPETRRQAADHFVTRLTELDDRRQETGKLPLMRHVIYKLPLGFFESRRLLYLNERDLLDVEDRLKRRLDQEKLKRNPFYVDLDELQETEVDISFQDLQRKYAVHRFREYSTDADDTLLALLMKPQEPASRLAFSQKLVAILQETARAVSSQNGLEDVTITFGGSYLEQLRDWTRLGNTTRTARTIFLIGYSLVVLLLFRRLRLLLILAFAMLCMAVWVRALASLLPFGITPFASISLPIVFGFGAAYALVLLYAYMAARDRNLDPGEALSHAVAGDGRVVIIGALATSAAAAGLLFVDVADFRTFSLLLSLGLLLALMAMLGPLLAALALWEQHYLMVVSAVVHIMNPMPRRIARGRALLLIGSILALVGAGALVQSYTCWIRNDTESCRNEPCCSPAIELNPSFSSSGHSDPILSEIRSKLRQVAPVTRDPVFLVAPDRESLQHIVGEVETLSRQSGSLIHSVYSLVTFMPPDQAAKREILKRIDGLATDENIRDLERATRQKIHDLRPVLHPPSITVYQLPTSILRAFSLQKPGEEVLLELLSQALARLGGDLGGEEWNLAISQHLDRLSDAEIRRVLARVERKSAPEEDNLTGKVRREHLKGLLRETHRHHVGVVGMIYPRKDLSDGRLARHFLEEMSPLTARHPGTILVGKAVDLGQTVQGAAFSGRWLLLWSLMALALVLLASLRHPLRGLVILVPLLAVLLWLAAGVALTGLRWNVYGLLALPLVIGVGLDLSLRIYLAYWESRQIGAMPALLASLPGLLLMSGTLALTLTGWLFADHAIVVSVAAVGVVGVILCLACTVGFLTPLLEHLHMRVRGR